MSPPEKEAPSSRKDGSSKGQSDEDNYSSSPVVSIIDPDSYRLKVLGLPKVNGGRYVEVNLGVFSSDDEEMGTVTEWFDIKQPKKLIRFLEAIGQPWSETEKFNISPVRWRNAKCDVLVVRKEWQDEAGQTKQRNILMEFTAI